MATGTDPQTPKMSKKSQKVCEFGGLSQAGGFSKALDVVRMSFQDCWHSASRRTFTQPRRLHM
eukprot:476493-Amphidinium_carterae.1